MAGTLAKWSRAGTEVITVCLTSGGAGSNASTPPGMTREDLAKIREEEQRRACRLLGIETVVFLGYEDGYLEPSLALRRDVTRVIRRYRPDAVVCSDPTIRFIGNRYINHPDHRAAGEVTLAAVFPSAETRFMFPELLAEGLEPHAVQTVWVHGPERPDTLIDIAGVLDLKIRAMRAHESQTRDWDPAAFLKERARREGRRRGLRAAEAFRRIVLGSAAD